VEGMLKRKCFEMMSKEVTTNSDATTTLFIDSCSSSARTQLNYLEHWY